MNVLNMEHISKVYGDKVIFDDISVGSIREIRLGSSGSMEPENNLSSDSCRTGGGR